MNQFQLILLTLLTNTNIPDKIIDYLSGMKSTTCSFGFLPFDKIPGLSSLVDYLDFRVSYFKLDYFGIESGSTIVSAFSLICVFSLIFTCHVIFIILFKYMDINIPESK